MKTKKRSSKKPVVIAGILTCVAAVLGLVCLIKRKAKRGRAM
ncbi:MAG: hypothetical protein ACI3XR_04075 [Eubacteriales bacterium]